MAAKKKVKASRKAKPLKAKNLTARQARDVKGGAVATTVSRYDKTCG